MNEPSRQIHLDFHTSEHIPDVGKYFSKEQFKEALQIGHINQINIFGKCHHSWCYYPTKLKHAKIHPNLNIDLLGQQIEACHEINVKAPIYLTVGWSAHDAEIHPEWCARNSDGSIIEFNKKTGNEIEEITSTGQHSDKEIRQKSKEFRPYCNWKFMCPSGNYEELISNMVTELCSNYQVDGFFFDIHFTQLKCYCDNCKQSIKETGYDIGNPEEVNAHWNEIVLKNFTKNMTAHIQSMKPDASIFYNGLTVLERKENLLYRVHENSTKNDLEDLPTTWGGYDKIATQSRYFHNYTNKPIIGMSGKFHTSWGEFGGFKYPEALKYEAAAMISHGARCNFGDHLHPSGEMDLDTYKNVGVAFEYIKKIEEYGIGGRPFSNIALYLTGSYNADDGVARMLLEEHIEYEVVSINASQERINNFELIIIPSSNTLSEEEIKKLKNFQNKGGALVVIGKGALNNKRDKFIFDLGAKYIGPSDFDMDYVQVRKELSNNLVSSPFITYLPGIKSEANEDSNILADIKVPYFSRTLEKYNGHLYAPNKLDKENYPAVIQYKNTVFFAHDLDRIYAENGSKVHRQLFGNTIRHLHKNLLIETKGLPSSGRITLLHQENKNRYVVHLLYAPPLQRGRCLIIEDVPEIHGVELNINLNEKIKKVYFVNLEKEIKIEDSKSIQIKVDKFQIHEALVLEY